MRVRSVKTNFFLNIIRILSSTLVGVFTMPYINNVLGPASLGKVEYVNSIISYFILFSALGIPMYGIRQVARSRNDANELSKNLIELLVILLFTSIISYAVLFSIILNLEIFSSYVDLIILMSSMILLNNLGAEWFFQGIEDQAYITIRYLIVRIITVILLFLLVKNADDFYLYGFIVVMNFCGSNFLNFYNLRKYIKVEHLKIENLNLKRHIKPAFTIFLASISVSLYLQIDTFFLGILAGDKYVGYYSVSSKLIRYVIGFITSLGAVMLPRITSTLNSDRESYENYMVKSLKFLIILSMPFVGYFYLFANEIVFYMAGNSYNASVLTMQILSPTCFLVGIAYFLGFLVLYPLNKEKLYTYSIMISAVLSIVLNYFLIKKFQHNGAAITQLFSELVGVIIMLFFIIKHKLFTGMKTAIFLKPIFAAVISVILLKFINIESENFTYFFTNTSLFFSFYVLSLYIVRDNTIYTIITEMINRRKQ